MTDSYADFLSALIVIVVVGFGLPWLWMKFWNWLERWTDDGTGSPAHRDPDLFKTRRW